MPPSRHEDLPKPLHTLHMKGTRLKEVHGLPVAVSLVYAAALSMGPRKIEPPRPVFLLEAERFQALQLVQYCEWPGPWEDARSYSNKRVSLNLHKRRLSCGDTLISSIVPLQVQAPAGVRKLAGPIPSKECSSLSRVHTGVISCGSIPD